VIEYTACGDIEKVCTPVLYY
jgi:hypothetical protein